MFKSNYDFQTDEMCNLYQKKIYYNIHEYSRIVMKENDCIAQKL